MLTISTDEQKRADRAIQVECRSALTLLSSAWVALVRRTSETKICFEE